MLNVLVIFLLILINGLFAMSEMAVVSSRKPKLQKLAEEGNRRAANALALAQDPNRFLSTVQVGITLVGVGSGAFGAASLAGPLSNLLGRLGLARAVSYPLSFGVLIVAITYISLVIGELVPKRLALNDPERVAMSIAGLMSRVSRIATPLVRLLSVSTDGLLRLVGARQSTDPPVSEEEINSLLQQGADAGVFEASDQSDCRKLVLARRPVCFFNHDASARHRLARGRQRYRHPQVAPRRLQLLAYLGLPGRPRRHRRHGAYPQLA